YGAAGSLAVFLIWIYYSALIFFLGAEFTQVYANRFGTRLVPEEGAVPVTEEARAEQGMAPRKGETPVAATAPYRPEPATVTAPPRRPSPARDESAAQYYAIAVLSVIIGLWRWLRGR